jgi:hypothetical protein
VGTHALSLFTYERGKQVLDVPVTPLFRVEPPTLKETKGNCQLTPSKIIHSLQYFFRATVSNSDFADLLEQYLEDIRSADNEAQRAQYFIEFLRRDLDVGADFIGQPTRIRPELEESLQATGEESRTDHSLTDFTGDDDDESEEDEEEKTVLIRGRLDARVGNLVMEFKDDLDADIEDAKSQLRRYSYLLYRETPEDDFVCFASDGQVFIPYEARIPENVTSQEDITLKELGDRIDLAQEEPDSVQRWFQSFINERVNPTVDTIDEWFGIGSEIYETSVEIIESAYDDSDNVQVHYREWRSYLQYAQGQTLEDVDAQQLFFRHTYLASFSKLLTYMVIVRGSAPSPEYASKILEGDIQEPLPQNLFDKDLFSWMGDASQSEELCEMLIDGLIRFNLGKVNQDIFKKLYQEMVSPDVRHDLGEYYTPDWLAWYIVDKMEIGDGERTLDPACGSGTFLVESIKAKRETTERQEADFIDSLQEEVVGIDVHPLAVATAKANYIASIRDMLQYRRSDFFVPVYLADSAFLQLLEEGDEDDTTASELGGVAVTETIEVGGENYRLPVDILDSPSQLDTALDLIRDNIHDADRLSYKLPDSLEEFAHVFEDIRSKMEQAERDDRDTIHAYILKNFYRPLYLSDSRFDVIVGNPPFLSYRFMSDRQQEDMSELMRRYNLSPGAENITQMDLASLFVMRSVDLYLEEDGRLGFVLPRTIYNGRQHEPFRKGEFTETFDITRVIDTRDVNPLFTIDTCAIIIQNGEDFGYPILEESITGDLARQNAKLVEADDSTVTTTDGGLSIDLKEIQLEEGETTSWADMITEMERSSYYQKFSDGATLYPRSFVLAELTPQAQEMGYDASQPPLRTAYRPRVNTDDDSPYSVVIEADVESDFIYGTLLGGDVVRFAHRPVRPCVMPISKTSSSYRMITLDQAENGPYDGLAEWLGQASENWNGDGERETLSGQYNYRNKLTGQSHGHSHYVVYLKDSTNIAACVIDVEAALEGAELPVNGLVIDHELFYYPTETEEEAYYLSAILNSDVINQAIKPLQAEGDFGPRHIHKLPLEFPIPEFDSENETHQRLVELAKSGEEKALAKLPDLVEEYDPDTTPTNSRWLRTRTNEEVESELEEVNRLVKNLL